MNNKNKSSVYLSDKTCEWITAWADICKDDAFSIIKEAVDSIHEKDNEWLDFMLIKGFSAIKVFCGCIENKNEIIYLISRFLFPFVLKEFPDLFENEASYLFIKKNGEKNFIELNEYFKKIMEAIKDKILLDKLHNTAKKEASYEAKQ